MLTLKDTPVVVVALANDLHPPGRTLSVAAPSTPGHGRASVVGGGGRLLRYEPEAGFVGEDSFTYEAVEGSNRSGATVTVRVEERPPAQFGRVLRVESGSCTTVLAPAKVGPQTVVVAGVTPAANGALVVHPEGARVDYSPGAGYHGSDGFVATISDGGPNPGFFAFAINVP